MKTRPKPIEYKFSLTKDDKILMSYRFGLGNRYGNCWCFAGIISEIEVKERLTAKQFAKYKNGFLGPFISGPIDPKDHNKIQRNRNKK